MTKKMLQKMAKWHAPREKIVSVAVDGETVDIKVKPVICLSDFGAAAKDIAEMQFIPDGAGGEKWAPYLTEFAKRYALVTYFTDLDLTALMKKTDGDATLEAAEPVWEFLWSGVFDEILNAIDSVCMYELVCAADALVERKCKTTEPGTDRLWAALDGLVKQTQEQMGDMTPEDGEKFRAVIDKLSGIDEGKIIELMR